MEWIEIYLNKNDFNQLMWNIDWESNEPKEVIEYLFNLVVEMRESDK